LATPDADEEGVDDEEEEEEEEVAAVTGGSSEKDSLESEASTLAVAAALWSAPVVAKELSFDLASSCTPSLFFSRS
jgi:hypothetical protein